MNSIMPIGEAFSQVYLVDFSPSLCEVARERVKRMGWTNVSVVCEDARKFRLQETDAEVITMSYSLSMIPDYYSVVDSLASLLSPDGIFGACDFYVQSIVDVSSRTYTGGTFNRHVNWLGRLFWRAWFDADRVNLDGGRRDYLEYKFGTVLSASDRNYLLGGIPYYIFLGCPTEVSNPLGRTQDMVDQLDAALTESPYLSPKDYERALSEAADDNSLIRSKAYESAIVNLSAKLPLPSTFYQNHHWRIYYNDLLQKHLQFNNEYIYAFNWEDPKVDRQLLNITKDDVILTITSAGDNVLDYLLESPRRIHAVDLNPNQNHLLELKIAAFTALPHEDVWSLVSPH
jgi:betaine lipid synthase